MESTALLFLLVNTLTTDEEKELSKELKAKPTQLHEFKKLLKLKSAGKKPADIESLAINQNQVRLKQSIYSFLLANNTDTLKKAQANVELIGLLCKRGMAEDAFNKISEFKRNYTNTEFEYLIPRVHRYYIKLRLANPVTGKDNMPEFLDLANQNKQMSEAALASAKIYLWYTRLSMLQSKGLVGLSAEDKIALAELENETTQLTSAHVTRLYDTTFLYMIKIGIARLKGQTALAMDLSEKLFIHFNQASVTDGVQAEDDELIHLYLRVATEVLNSCVLLQTPHKMEHILPPFRQMVYKYNQTNPTKNIEAALFYWEYYYVTGIQPDNKEVLKSETEKLSKFYNAHKNEITVEAGVLIASFLMQGFAELKDYERTLKIAEDLIHKNIHNISGAAVKNFNRLYWLLIAFESSMYKSNNVRFLQGLNTYKHKLTNAYEKALVSFFKTISKAGIRKKEIRLALEELHTKLKDLLITDEEFKNDNQVFSFTGWVEKRIEEWTSPLVF